MRHLRHERAFFRGKELSRLAVMVGMLIVLVLMIGRARDPDSWKWLPGEGPSVVNAGGSPADSSTPSPAAPMSSGPVVGVAQVVTPSAPERTNDPPGKSTGGLSQAPSVAGSGLGPLDQDPQEQAAIAMELEVVTDKTLEMSKLENRAYRRLIQWTQGASLDDLKRRAKPVVAFNSFAQSPGDLRGKLFRLDLHVKRIDRLERQRDWPQGVPDLYELWGVTDQSGVWLYDAITCELPRGMPVGDVYENVTFYGFFLKLQGYQQRGAKPGAPALFAPMLIGRVVWNKPQPTIAAVETGPSAWVWWLVGGAVAVVLTVIGIASTFGLFRGKATGPRAEEAQRREELAEWVKEGAPQDEGPIEEEPAADVSEAEGAGVDPLEGILPPEPRKE